MAADIELLRRAILDAPDDDAPRLMYADALEEQGHGAMAEFIRVQCEFERGPNWKDCEDCQGAAKVGPCGLTNYWRDCHLCPERRERLLDRERYLWTTSVHTRLVSELIFPVAPYLDNAHISIHFNPARPAVIAIRRGFPNYFRTTTQEFLGLPPIALAHLGRMPLRVVDLIDRSPICTFGGQYVWSCDDEDVMRADWLPYKIWVHLGKNADLKRSYPTHVAACDAMSAAAIKYLRQVANGADVHEV
jgi:uncharacterized protein (TIGR02996 family)